MNMALWVLSLLAAATAAGAQESSAPAPGPDPKPQPAPAMVSPQPARPATAPVADSPLVAAAKKAKGGKIKPGTVITNDNMKEIKGLGGSVIYANPGDPDAPAYNPADSQAAGGGRTREDWQKLMSSARGSVSNAESRIATLQSQVAKLENDFYSWDDPAYRDGVIKPALDQAKADLEASRHSLETAKQRVLDLEEEARKAGAPPGWLR